MVPACASCNRMKSNETIEQFRATIKRFINSLNRYSVQYRFAKLYGLVEENDIEVEFWFENQG